jgi:hypothetical protein
LVPPGELTIQGFVAPVDLLIESGLRGELLIDLAASFGLCSGAEAPFGPVLNVAAGPRPTRRFGEAVGNSLRRFTDGGTVILETHFSTGRIAADRVCAERFFAALRMTAPPSCCSLPAAGRLQQNGWSILV